VRILRIYLTYDVCVSYTITQLLVVEHSCVMKLVFELIVSNVSTKYTCLPSNTTQFVNLTIVKVICQVLASCEMLRTTNR